MVIVMTTAPLCLYIKVIYGISEEFELDFYAMYACVGCWNVSKPGLLNQQKRANCFGAN